MAQQRKCPFCEEEVIGEAVVCHFCGRDLPPDGASAESGVRAAWRTARTFVVIVLAMLLLIVLVFALRSWLARPSLLPGLALLVFTQYTVQAARNSRL